MQYLGALYLFVWVVLGAGWILNIIAIIHTGFTVANWGGMQVIRIVGIFVAPLGGVVGWL